MKKFNFTINGNKYSVLVNSVEGNEAELEVNGTPFTVEIEREEKEKATTMSNNAPTAAHKAAGKVPTVSIPTQAPTSSVIKAPLPGSITKVLVSAGQAVKRGDVLLTMESMKMENNILAESDGKVKNILVSAGQSVMQGDNLVELEGSSTAAAQPAAAPVAAPAAKPAAKPAAAPQPASKPAAGGAGSIKAPLPGSIMKVLVSAGQAVKRGDVLLTMESMKMENSIMAEKDCTIKNIRVATGQNVMQGDVLVDIE